VTILSRPSFDRAFRDLSPQIQAEVRSAITLLPEAFGKPHIHAGLGVRKVGKYIELRVGLKWRVLFMIRKGDVVLVTVGNHDDIVRFVRDNPKG
jgi:mRNA-degrading endonuclease RelE of RelBE toxin-antitoxin system